MKSQMEFRPGNPQELSEIVRMADSVRISGYWSICNDDQQPNSEIELGGMSGIIDFSPADQVVKLRSGTTIGDLNAELASAGQIIPVFKSNVSEPWGAWESLKIADCLAWNLPHGLESQHGSWRDWILGATIVGADGVIFKSGSSVVKSVAGYDLHRLMIGARHTLGIVSEVTLRTHPISAMCPSTIEVAGTNGVEAPAAWRIQRCLRSDWLEMKQALSGSLVAADPDTCTVFSYSTKNEPLRYSNDWIIETDSQTQNIGQIQATYMKRAKQIFDPSAKLNPGAMGIF